jgi:hypothetical protein
MKERNRLFLRRKSVYYAFDNTTKTFESLKTKDKAEANREYFPHHKPRIPHQIQTPQITIPNETLQPAPLSNRHHRCPSKHQVQILLERTRRRAKERSPGLS